MPVIFAFWDILPLHFACKYGSRYQSSDSAQASSSSNACIFSYPPCNLTQHISLEPPQSQLRRQWQTRQYQPRHGFLQQCRSTPKTYRHLRHCSDPCARRNEPQSRRAQINSRFWKSACCSWLGANIRPFAAPCPQPFSSAILPVNPSVTTTSTSPRPMPSPSTKPLKFNSDRSSKSSAALLTPHLCPSFLPCRYSTCRFVGFFRPNTVRA